MLETLNTKQRDAILDESERLLILAGAGSGKTKTLTRKIEYLVKQKGVSSSSILAITFTKNAANEMTDRLITGNDADGNYEKILNSAPPEVVEMERQAFRKKTGWIDKLTIVTFHSLCYKIMKHAGVKVFDNRFKILADDDFEKITDEAQTETPSTLMYKAILECAAEDQQFLLKLKWYLVNYLVKNKAKQTSGNYHHPQGLIYTTLNGEKVRSKSEVFIADWLFRHGIEYKYELREESNGKVFFPDFYIPAANLYIEHKSDLSRGVELKRDILRIRHQHVAVTHEDEIYDVSDFSMELDRILRNRFSPASNNVRIISVKEVTRPYAEEMKSFIKMIKTTIDLIKVEAKNADEIIRRGKTDQHKRVAEFYELFEVIHKRYENLCVSNSFLDFNDLVIRANELLRSKNDVADEYRKKYRHILVDEFQDVNKLQVDLLKLLTGEKTQLFCVGDDWQSIYGFRGSDVDYIVNFNSHFPDSRVINLDLNYRSTKTIVSAGNEVMKNNQKKMEKELHAINTDLSKINVYVSNKEKDDGVKYVRKRIEQLLHAGIPKDEILVLARRSAMLYDYRQAIRQAMLGVTCRTIHSSKGLEARVVFLVGMKEGSGGFPDFWLNDRIYQVVRPEDIKAMEEEERRLFYVAITRAKEELVLITEANSESSYIREIPSHFLNRVSVEVHQQAKIMTCRACGSTLYKASNFCPDCGGAIKEDR